jgi:AcrR family transcriptional regulator
VTTVRKRPTRDRVLAAAHELFYAEGYEVSVDAIAERADVAKPTIYAHFTSKTALVEAVLQAGSDAFFATLEAELERLDGDPDRQLLAAFDLLVADLPDPAYRGCLCVNAAATFTSADHPAHRVLRELDERVLGHFEEIAGRAGATNPAALARQLLLLFDGIKVHGLIDDSGAAAADARAAATTLLERARTGPT